MRRFSVLLTAFCSIGLAGGPDLSFAQTAGIPTIAKATTAVAVVVPSGPLDDQFQRANGVVANSWNDLNGKWSIVGNTLQSTSTNYHADWLLRPAAESAGDQQVTIRVPLVAQNSGSGVAGCSTPFLVARAATNNSGYLAWVGVDKATTVNIGRMVAGTLNLVVSSTPIIGLKDGAEVVVTLHAVGHVLTATVASSSAPTTVIAQVALPDYTFATGLQGVVPNGIPLNTVRGFSVQTSGINAPRLDLTGKRLGVGIDIINNASPDLAFADCIKLIGGFPKVATPYGPTAVPIDANGWPKTDFGIGLLSGEAASCGQGRYTAYFTGKAIFAPALTANARIVSNTYHARTNRTVACIDVVGDPGGQVTVTLTQTKRLPTDSPGTGLTNLKIMRPIAQGSTTSHHPRETFTRAFLSLLAPFHHVRFLNWGNANNNYNDDLTALIPWSSRTLPTAMIQTQAGSLDGTAYEYMIALCNANNQDLWVNIPDMASDDYFTQFCNLIMFGSDAKGIVYPSVQANPVHPPLKGRVIIQFSNETWNFGFHQHGRIQARALADVAARAATNPPLARDLDWDGMTNGTYLGWRFAAKQTLHWSGMIKSRFGANALKTKFHLVLMGQNGYGDTLETQVQYIGFHTGGAVNGTGGQISQAIYGIGASWYRTMTLSAPDPKSAWYSATDATQGHSVAQIIAAGAKPDDPQIALTTGFIQKYDPQLRHLNYEGGIGSNGGQPGNDYTVTSLSRRVNLDRGMGPLTTNLITDVYLGGAQEITYFTSAGGPYGLTGNPYSPSTPKQQAVSRFIAAINAANPSIPVPTVRANPATAVDGAKSTPRP